LIRVAGYVSFDAAFLKHFEDVLVLWFVVIDQETFVLSHPAAFATT
jgi:hypothetical protein